MIFNGPRPTTPPLVSFAQMQQQLRIDSTDEKTYIESLIEAAIDYAEAATESSLLIRTCTVIHDERSALYPLPRGPVASVSGVIDADGQPIAQYSRVRRGVLDAVQVHQAAALPITITYEAGYGEDVDWVPADLRMAIRTHVASLWRHRESVSDKTMVEVPQSLADFYKLRRRATGVA